MDSAQRRLAERRLVGAVRRLHRREPLRPGLRTDAVLRELRADPGERLPAGHRGGGSLQQASDADLLAIVDALVASGKLLRRGHRVRLAEHEPIILDSEMRARVDRLLAGLRDAGAEPPRVEGVAARLGIPPGVVAQLRVAGQLVTVGEGIDYPRDVLNGLLSRMAEIATRGPLTITRVRDVLRTSRRHAEALLAYRRARRPNATG
ncbi:MAG: hypothetical protein E6J50_07865 [Chloroflexi bacterium]|nr:MAG: hypothetical protein E6J50_07865 [Chloroflexota bacterium]